VWPRRQYRTDDFLNQPDYGDRNDDDGYWDVHYGDRNDDDGYWDVHYEYYEYWDD
jgi:hypothetical protein